MLNLLLFLDMIRNLVILFLTVLCIVTFLFSYMQIVMAENPKTILKKTNDNGKDNDKLVVVFTINLQNISKI